MAGRGPAPPPRGPVGQLTRAFSLPLADARGPARSALLLPRRSRVELGGSNRTSVIFQDPETLAIFCRFVRYKVLFQPRGLPLLRGC